MADARKHFQEDLEAMEAKLIAMGEVARGAVKEAGEVVSSETGAAAEGVVETIRALDADTSEFERRWLGTMALQTPVAEELRLMSVFLNCNHSLQRIGHQAASIAKIAIATRGLPHHPPIDSQIREMTDRVVPMLGMALESFGTRDVSAVAKLREMDQLVNDLNRNTYKLVVACSADTGRLEWATRMMVVARALERVGDRAVAIARQVRFLVIGSYDDESD